MLGSLWFFVFGVWCGRMDTLFLGFFDSVVFLVFISQLKVRGM